MIMIILMIMMMTALIMNFMIRRSSVTMVIEMLMAMIVIGTMMIDD